MAAANPRSDLATPLLAAQPHIVFEIESNGSDGGEQNPYEFLGAGPLSLPPPSPINPFRNHTPYIGGLYEYLKIVVCIPIALVRLVLFGMCLLVGFLATKLALQGWKDKQNPMPKWRCRLMWITRICARCILFSFGYHWIRRVGRPASRAVAPIVVSNHVSYIEPIFFFYELFPTIVASESHDSIPFVGTIIRAMQRKASCDRFPRVLLFPEGTTTNGRVLISFQLGAFIPGYTIQPVVVRYPHVHFDQSWGNISLVKLMFRMFTQFHNFMEVEYLPVIAPLDNKKENAGQFAERTSYALASALNVVQTFHSYGDLMLLTKASEQRQWNASGYMMEMAWVESTFNINTLEAMEFLDKFLAMNPDSGGRVKIHDFSRILRLESCPLSERIFAFLDVEKLGSITFRQFLLGSAHILKLPVFQHACNAAFDGCDQEAKGYITREQFGGAIGSVVPNLNDYYVSQLFDLFDSDKDGAVSSGDFMACLRRNPLLIALFACNTTLIGGKLEVV